MLKHYVKNVMVCAIHLMLNCSLLGCSIWTIFSHFKIDEVLLSLASFLFPGRFCLHDSSGVISSVAINSPRCGMYLFLSQLYSITASLSTIFDRSSPIRSRPPSYVTLDKAMYIIPGTKQADLVSTIAVLKLSPGDL